jgi:hypothetical protein
LAKALIELFTPVKLGKVFFCNSGSEANDTQVNYDLVTPCRVICTLKVCMLMVHDLVP